MGVSEVLPAVEESTEPPICGHSSTHHGLQTTTGQHPRLQPHDGQAGTAPPALTAAHTLTSTQVAQELAVDIR
jgi:Na+-exporting ATPase